MDKAGVKKFLQILIIAFANYQMPKMNQQLEKFLKASGVKTEKALT